MSDIVAWLLLACLVLIIVAFFFVVLVMIGAAFWGLWRGVKQLRGREVSVQDKTLPPPT